MQVFSQLNACRIDFRQGRNSPRAERRADSRIADRAMQWMGSTLVDRTDSLRIQKAFNTDAASIDPGGRSYHANGRLHS